MAASPASRVVIYYGHIDIVCTRGEIVSDIKLRRAKVVRSGRRYSQNKTVSCICPDIASAGGSFPREEKCKRCGGRVLLLLLCACRHAKVVRSGRL